MKQQSSLLLMVIKKRWKHAFNILVFSSNTNAFYNLSTENKMS